MHELLRFDGDGGMTKRLLAMAATIAVLSGMLACSTDKYGFKLYATKVNGSGTLGLSDSGQPVKALIVYFHGADQKASVIEDDQKHTDFFDPLLRAGYAVVSADAGGNAFGNPASRDAYRKLIVAALAKYGDVPVFFVAESMGALAALALIADDSAHSIKGMVGVSPLMGLPPDIRTVSFIKGVWGGEVPDSGDPLSWPPEMLANRNFLLYASRDDRVIPADASAQAFALRFGAVARIETVDCAGGHVAVACYQGDGVKKWFANLD